MKTAIIKTTFWEDESFEKLHIDSKLVYFYLLSNPTRTLHKITKLNNKICVVHTGLSLGHVEKGLKQLQKEKLILKKEKYYVLLKDFVEAKKGRFTSNVILKEEKEIPKHILDFFKNYTGTVPVYIYNNNNNNKDKDNNKDIDIEKKEMYSKCIQNVSKQDFNFKKELLNLSNDENLVNDFMEVRKKKKAINSERSFKGFIREVKKSKKPINEILELCCEKGWKGFEADWVGNIKGKNNNNEKEIFIW